MRAGVSLSAVFLSLCACMVAMPAYTADAPEDVAARFAALEDSAHPVAFDRELLITDLDIVQNSAAAQPQGAWHFRSLMERLARPGDVEDFVAAFAGAWDDTQRYGVDKAEPKPHIAETLRRAWKEDRIDLIAIVNRMDLARRGVAEDGEVFMSSLGEGRLIYQLMDEQREFYLDFTIIVEFRLPFLHGDATPGGDLRSWARAWRSLGDDRLGLSARMARLEEIVGLFATRYNLAQVRINEKDTGPIWEMREFGIHDGVLRQRAVAQTPYDTLKDNRKRSVLDNYVAKRTELIIAGEHDFAASAEGENLLGIKSQFHSSANARWYQATDLSSSDGDAHRFARATYIVGFNACNGCHKDITGENQHVRRVAVGGEAQLSRFLEQRITVDEALPGCHPDEAPARTWCGADWWNERVMREALLQSAASEQSAGEPPSLLPDLLQHLKFRVH